MKTPITGKTLRAHLVYNSWKYILLTILVLVSWNLIFTSTAYRPPAEKIVDVYIYGYPEVDTLQAYLDKVHAEEMSDMEQMSVNTLMSDDTYGDMVLMTRLAAAEGDIYILPREKWQSLAGEGALLALSDDLDAVKQLTESGANLERGQYRISDPDSDETHERRLYGIPAVQLPGLEQMLFGATGSDYVVCVLAANGNEENVLRFLSILVRDTMTLPETAAQ